MPVPLLFGPYGGAKRPQDLCQYGVNAIWFHDFNAKYLDVCRQYDLAACVEFPTFRADFAKRPELIPVGTDGRPIRYGPLVQGVCLSKTEFVQEVEARLRDGVETYAPTGIWLDYLAGAGWFETPSPDLQDSCFCRGCIDDFCQSTGIDAVAPDHILAQYAREWAHHKCSRIARLAAGYARIIRDRLPQCVIGGYMCPWRPEEFDGALTRIFAQDYQLLADSIDVFTPLIYVAKSGRSAAWGCQFLQSSATFAPANRPVQLILDMLDFPDSLLAVANCPQPSWGLQIFGGTPIFESPSSGTLFRMAVEKIRQTAQGAS